MVKVREEWKKQKKDANLREVYESGDLRKVTDELPNECLGNAISFLSSFDAYSRRFEDITGIILSDPTDESRLISDNDIDILNTDVKEVKELMSSLCLCISKHKK